MPAPFDDRALWGCFMAAIPKKVTERFTAALKRFQPVIQSARTRDVNESDTVIIVTDMLGELFGYDKYSEITSEHAIKGTYCDLAVRLDGAVQLLIEVKAIGLELKDGFVKQAVDYAANQGVDWVVLTNGELWRCYRIAFSKPIEAELVFELNVSKMDARNENDLGMLFTLSKEGWGKSALGDYHEQRQALSRFFIAALLQSDAVVDVVRRELKKVSPDVKVEQDQIRDVLVQEVLKRDVLEGERADQAKKRIKKAADKMAKAKAKKEETADVVLPKKDDVAANTDAVTPDDVVN
jgi:hypothetical protein